MFPLKFHFPKIMFTGAALLCRPAVSVLAQNKAAALGNRSAIESLKGGGVKKG